MFADRHELQITTNPYGKKDIVQQLFQHPQRKPACSRLYIKLASDCTTPHFGHLIKPAFQRNWNGEPMRTGVDALPRLHAIAVTSCSPGRAPVCCDWFDWRLADQQKVHGQRLSNSYDILEPAKWVRIVPESLGIMRPRSKFPQRHTTKEGDLNAVDTSTQRLTQVCGAKPEE